MNPCTCELGAMGRLMCTLHGVRVNDTSRSEEPERDTDGLFEGMSRFGLSQLADLPVGTERHINGHTVWRWEESSPITRILSDGRPQGAVKLTAEWMAYTPDLGNADSPLRAAIMRWAGAGREWFRDEDILDWSTIIRWRTKGGPEVPGTAVTTYAGEPLG